MIHIEEYNPVQQFAELHALIVDMVDAPGGEPIPEGMQWMADRQTLSKKFAHHLHTIAQIHQGSVLLVGDVGLRFIDHGSVKVIARAVLENFIVFAQVFGDHNPEVCRFRHMTWKLGGLLDRQSLSASTADSKSRLAAEKLRIDQLSAEVRRHPVFQTLTNGAQKAILKGDWKTGRSWQALAKESGLSEGYFRNIYSYLCGYSHSSYAAAMQVGQANDLAVQSSLSSSMLGVMCLCMARFASIYAGLFPSARAVLERERRPAMEMWDISAAHLEEVYAGQ
ncbi:hypothetical protein [Comamonas endophytica]|uniref:HTH araC/xylS-type domain-containing protein n=1 Tax=Comamonas endophytica TaxID=2949090 RepID=A0ABY6GG32_9BURK|nr:MULTISPECIES: hypothetical protein [unclassified Acidovorax]MCD2514617.1 hypothetical protein [Acidovorax sp. D4N7]UYG54050.1 hypothetical protein M9799_20210 [Acidovorax sp. 5MLIR]